MNLGTARVIRADARHLPLPDNSVDLVVTSPPYLNLRSYQDEVLCLACIDAKGDGRDLRQVWPDYAAHAKAEHYRHHYDGQIGSEATQADFLDSLLEVTAECVRVVKPSGSIFVNLGDSYRDKGLQFTPERYRIRVADELGLIGRAVVIWSKPNGLPESVTDRVRRSHEDWVHFTLSPRYFSAVDEIREPHVEGQRPGVLTWEQRRARDDRAARYSDQNGHGGTAGMAQSPLGKLPGSVWTIPTEPLRVPDHLGVDHFAAFPTEWPKRIIQGWSPAGVCVECGEGRRPVSVKSAGSLAPADAWGGASPDSKFRRVGATFGVGVETSITGYACACPEPTAPTTPGVVLDPFGGTGTTAMVAKALGRDGISVDMSGDYSRLAEWRCNDPAQLAKVLGLGKPDVQPEDQGSIFDLLGGGAA